MAEPLSSFHWVYQFADSGVVKTVKEYEWSKIEMLVWYWYWQEAVSKC